ncbi:hypothetical protein [Nitrospira sp. Nam80]
MIIRVEVQHHTGTPAYWQLKRCQVQVGGLMQDVSNPALLRPIRFDTLEESIRHAKKATFGYLEAKRHKEMPDQMDWRVYEEGRLFPCPVCQQPLYRKAKLGRFGNSLDLHDWGCVRCKKTVTVNTAGLVSGDSAPSHLTPVPAAPSQERVISLPSTAWTANTQDNAIAAAVVSPLLDKSSSPVLR